ncbi:MAG: hypothetical protein EZS28_038057 [Streblomastix strix]|uniref:Uncharacterized protein n=1 Tax=Streblomastix strix TaxID=222440 RepID=A0A5J4U751_9EUKA|nr:MAG: hypothetical protein EZS28_038057 [Streblomastix strix]
MPIHVEQQEFSAMCLFKDMYDKSSAVQVAVCGQLNMLDCECQGTYILDNYTNSTNTNESASNEAASDSFIDEHIIRSISSMMALAESQEVGRIPDSILPADGKKPQESIPSDSDDVYKHCASGMYYL